MDTWPDTSFSFGEQVARRKLGALPDGWEVCRWSCIGTDAVLYEGGVPTVVERGPNKGKKRWRGPMQSAVVTDAEERAERARYERETGRCANCYGSGRQWAGWHYQEVTKYRPCCACGATGRVKNTGVDAAATASAATSHG